jgi:hypothetical protein
MIENREQIAEYRVAEFVTLTRTGEPICWPLGPALEDGRLVFSTGFAYPIKANNARRNPKVCALYSDPTASGRGENDPQVLIQGDATVLDEDLQANTDRYVRQLSNYMPGFARMIMFRQKMVGYLARIFIEVSPTTERAWRAGEPVPEARAVRPEAFTPGEAIDVAEQVSGWMPRYPRAPILSWVESNGYPACARVQGTIESDRIVIHGGVPADSGAPACLTWHQLTGNYRSNDSFLIRGHLIDAQTFVPEKVVGYGGTSDDRGVGSKKMFGFFREWRQIVEERCAAEGRPVPVVRRKPPA